MTELANSLRQTVEGSKSERMRDTRFLFGTEAGNYRPPPPEAYECWRPLPVSHLQNQVTEAGRHLISKSQIFPRLASSFEEAKGKLVPKLTEFVAACKKLDTEGDEGLLSDEDVTAAIKETGVFLSSADLEALLPKAPRVPNGLIKYQEFADLLLGHVPPPGLQTTPSGLLAGRPTLALSFHWPDDQNFDVVLRARPDSRPFTIDAALMQKYAQKATAMRRLEHDAEKVHGMLRLLIFEDLMIEAGKPGRPSLDFRKWLGDHGVLSLSTRQRPGPIIPEVYDCLDQIIYDGLGFPRVQPTTQVLTSLQSSLRRHHTGSGSSPNNTGALGSTGGLQATGASASS